MYGPLEPIIRAMGFADPRATTRNVQFFGHFIAGLPGVMIGFFLLAPMFVWTIEKVLGPVIAIVFNLRYSLLRQQLSGGLWRSAGTCASLMVGLAILVVLQIQGTTALAGWRLPEHFPDVFIFSPVALNAADQAKLRSTPGIKSNEVMPIAMASPQFGSSLFAIASSMVMPDATMFFGVDPDLMFKMMELEFRDRKGQAVSDDEQKKMAKYATAMLKKGRHIIVTDEFRQLKNLYIGDTIPLQTTLHGTVDYTICGVVWSPGIDVMSSRFDLGRQLEQRTAASIFGSLADAKNDFGVEGAYLFCANLDYFTERDEVLKELKQRLATQNITVADVRQIKKGIQDGLGNLLLLISTVAFAAMAIASLGVTNTVMASVRSRRWQFGVLRSIGVTRTQLLRLVLAEAILLGLVGVGLGLAAGGELALNAHALTRITVGYVSPTVIPWGIILLGAGIVMAISIVASLWPAISTARAQPLALLSVGRASA
jgi:putative ABC transport system permease protein